MDKKPLINLCLSIYYHNSGWYKLLCEKIYPFIEESNDIDGFAIYLSTERGDHIRFVLITKIQNSKLLAKKADEYFKEFLDKWPSNNSANLIPSNGFFKDFNNNSIHFNVFDFFYKMTPPNVFRNYLQGVSLTLIQIFRTYKKDTLDEIIGIMIQAFEIFSQKVQLNMEETTNLFNSLLEKEYAKFTTEDLSKIRTSNKENFIENRHIIKVYLKEFRQSISNENLNEWSVIWSNTIMVCNNSLKESCAKNEIEENYRYMISSLCNAFDFEQRMIVYYMYINGLKTISF